MSSYLSQKNISMKRSNVSTRLSLLSCPIWNTTCLLSTSIRTSSRISSIRFVPIRTISHQIDSMTSLPSLILMSLSNQLTLLFSMLRLMFLTHIKTPCSMNAANLLELAFCLRLFRRKKSESFHLIVL